ncbi:hypothetical protein, partial [Chitinophaga hostae]
MKSIASYLEEHGPTLSSDLIIHIVSSSKVSESAARKKIERLTSPVHKLNGYFADRQSLLYHQSDFNNENYFEGLARAFEKAGKRYSAIITAMNYHHGIIAKKDLANYSFSPITDKKGHLTFHSLIENLMKLGVIYEYDNDHYQLNSSLFQKEEINYRYYKAIEFTKNLLLNNFNAWSRNLGLVSYAKGEYNNQVSGFQFSYTAPSYISGLVQSKDGILKPGFLTADVLIGNNTGINETSFFIKKIDIIKASSPGIRLFPVLIMDGVEVNALNKLKQNGVFIANIREIFGAEYNELLKSLINTITNAGTILKKEPEKYIDLMVQLSKLVDGKTNNLRGDLFELAVGYYYGQMCQFLEIGKKLRIEGEPRPREIDVFAVYHNEIKLVECKGYNYAVDDTFVAKYLSDKIPTAKKWLDNGTYREHAYTFEIWSTGGFTPEAILLLEKA